MEAEYDVGDVLIIGAGVSGVLLALRLLKGQYRVTLIDCMGLGAEQSGHSHGYLHHGYIYRHGQVELVKHLREGADRWREILTDYRVAPLARSSCICFSNEMTARAASAAWRTMGLPVKAMDDLPLGIRRPQVGAAFSTDEETYDFSAFFRAVTRFGNLTTIQAEAKNLRRRGDRIESVVVETNGTRVRLRARAVVLAAGDQNARLAETATRFSGRARVRSSLMLVIRGNHLPLLSMVMPENETYGLFVVSRPAASGTVWLASNFISFSGGSLSPEAVDRWLCALVDKLAVNCNGLGDERTEWGIYEAPKAELRERPQVLGAHAAEGYGMNNFWVLAPTKLTLAPILAREVAAMMERRLRGSANEPGDLVPGPPLGVCEERWTQTPVEPAESFFSRPGRKQGLSRLQRYARPRSTVV